MFTLKILGKRVTDSCSQIVVGLSSGAIDVLYSPVTSTNGAKLVLSKGPARKYAIEDMSGALVAQTILTPHALPAFRDGTVSANVDSQDNLVGGWGLVGSKRKRDKDRQDPRKSRRPELPVTGPGKGGRVGASATQHVVQNLVRDTTRDEDVSALLLSCLPRLAEMLVLAFCSSDAMSTIDDTNCAIWLFYFYFFIASRGIAQICHSLERGPSVDIRFVLLFLPVGRVPAD